MLRGIDEYDGAGVYIRKLVDALLELDRVNHYVLFYDRDSQLGRYAGRPNVREVVVRAPGKLLWDQVAVPLAAVPSPARPPRDRRVRPGRPRSRRAPAANRCRPAMCRCSPTTRPVPPRWPGRTGSRWPSGRRPVPA